jgi:hypothetical protein
LKNDCITGLIGIKGGLTMDTLQQKKLYIGDLVFIEAPDTLTIWDIANREGWKDVSLFGKGGMIYKHTKVNGWDIFPVMDFKRNIPQEAKNRVAVLNKYDHMVNPKIIGFLIADDLRHAKNKSLAENLEKAKERAKNLYINKVVEPVQMIDWEKVGNTTGTVIKWLAIAAGAVMAIGVLAAAAFAILPVFLIGGALVYDPVLIAVTEDDEWVALYEWWD